MKKKTPSRKKISRPVVLDPAFVELLKKHALLFHKSENEFKALFGVPLEKFWDTATGFDVVGFDDDFIKAPKGESTEQAVSRQYGERAAKLIWELLGM